MAKSGEEMTWMNVGVRVFLSAATHPLEYAKVLIQIGHEPLPAYRSRTIFGREQLFYPSIFTYVRYIKKTDGFVGCYRGLTPKIAANIVSGFTFSKVSGAIEVENDDADSETLNEEERRMRFLKRTGRESLARSAGIIVSQPLHVIAVRTMAEFVGNDGVYTGVFASIQVIYKEEGILGFFAGLIPRLLCDIGALWLSNTVIYVLNNYLIEDRDVKKYVSASVKFLSSAMWYPLQVVSNCMAVSGSGLVAGSPPSMPLYGCWQDCFSHLKSINGLKRGSTLLWRKYTGPTMLSSAGSPGVPTSMMFAQPLAKLD